MTDYRNIQDLDEFDNLVENFVKNRLQLKQKVKQERGNLSRKKADAKLKAEPITESLAELKTSLAEKGGFLKMFERFSGVSKSQSEIKLTTKANEGRLGTHGFVDLADLQDGILRVRNSKTTLPTSKMPCTYVGEGDLKLIKTFSTYCFLIHKTKRYLHLPV